MNLIKVMFCVFLSLASDGLQAHGVYLWEYREEFDQSCCLYVSGLGDICNPNTPCTRNFHVDLSGIFDYVTRLLATEKGSSFSYSKLLQQTQLFIRHMYASSFSGLSYRFDQQRPVQFLHNLPDTTKNDKSAKSATSSTTTTAAAEKAKGEDVVLQYLIKLGIAKPLK